MGIRRTLAGMMLRGYKVLAKAARSGLSLGALRTSGDTEWRQGASRLAWTARELVRNDPLAARVVALVKQRAIGRTGIQLRMATGNEAVDSSIEAAFAEWSKAVTPDGRSLREVQSLWASETATVGEGLGYHFIHPRTGRFLVNPFESEDLDIHRGQWESPAEFGGIVFDDYGVPLMYRVARKKPGGWHDYVDFVDVPADQVIHIRLTRRPSDSRGTSPFDAVAYLLYLISTGSEAELEALRASAHFGLHVKTEDPPEEVLDGLMGGQQTASDGQREIEFGPGGFVNVGNYDAKMLSADRPGGAYVPFVQFLVRVVAARFDVAYAALSGDYSQNSGTNGRLEEIVTSSGNFAWQTLIAEHGLDRLFRPWLRWAWTSGLVDLGGLSFDQVVAGSSWIFPASPILDEQRQAMADTMNLKTGAKSWSQIVSERGNDPRQHLRNLKKEQEMAATEGVDIPHAGAGFSDVKAPTTTNVEGEGGGFQGPANGDQGNASKAAA
jgi:lambda family phage portal protein